MKRESSNIDPETQPQRFLKVTSFKRKKHIAWGFASSYQLSERDLPGQTSHVFPTPH